jgi:hypothetical protein
LGVFFRSKVSGEGRVHAIEHLDYRVRSAYTGGDGRGVSMIESDIHEDEIYIPREPLKDSDTLGAVGRALAEHFAKYKDLLKTASPQDISVGPMRDDL